MQELDAKGLRRFAFAAAGLVAAVFGFALPWVYGYARPSWPMITASALTVWGLLHPGSLRYLYHGWMKLSLFLGRVNSYMLLTIVFYLVIVPAGMVMRLAGHDPMRRRIGTSARSYRKESDLLSPNHMEKPY